ncbi:MAG: tyrosine-type recombinase/integrase [Chloroflexi bacterium]|nr:tyrosine-type recombinase/integrase [Chloroflexota bacterium]
MKLLKAIEIFIVARVAEGYSANTLAYYKLYLHRLSKFLDNPNLDDIQSTDLQRYFSWLRTEYIPNRASGDTSPLKPVSLSNHWAALRSFFGWTSEEFGTTRPDTNLKAPRFLNSVVIPFSKEDIVLLLKAVEYTKTSDTIKRKAFKMKRKTAKRDRAIILLFLETGIRASECARLKMRDISLPEMGNGITQGRVVIEPYGSGHKSKGRIVHITAATIKALMVYHAEDRMDKLYPDDPVLATKDNRPMNRNSIRQMLIKTGKRAGVENANPHRFRHTFAIEFLRNGGNPFVLQKLIGHSTLDMVKRYLHIVQSDLAEAQQSASPVVRWRL